MDNNLLREISDLLVTLNIQSTRTLEIAFEIAEELKNDSLNTNELENKMELWMETTNTKVIGYTYRIPEETHIQFKQKCINEGYSIQEGIARLIDAFVSDNIQIKGD